MRVYKVSNICCAHQLQLPYESKCNNLHGHNYKIEVWIEGDINKNGMVVDFTGIKKIIDYFDHKNLNNLMSIPPTAENFTKLLITDLKNYCEAKKIKVRVWETDTCYTEDEWQSE